MLTCKYALWKKKYYIFENQVLKVWHCFPSLQIYLIPTWIGKTWVFLPASSLHLLQSVVSMERQPSNPDSLILSREKKTSLVLQRVLRDHPQLSQNDHWALPKSTTVPSWSLINPLRAETLLADLTKKWRLRNRDVRVQCESHTQLRRGRAETQTCIGLSESISDLKRSTMDAPHYFPSPKPT